MEIWKDCVGYEGLYQVSNLGRVLSVRYQKILKPMLRRNNYLAVNLYDKNGKLKTERIHRLVALAFIPNPEHKPEVNHKDENKLNNCVENLEWMTHTENINYGSRNRRAGEAHRKAIYCVELDRTFISISNASRELNINIGNICDACSGKYKTAGGYHWKYA